MTTDNANVTVRKGDLFESDAHALVNTVNTVGIMGKGVALGFKKRFPDMFEDYRERCARREVRLGEPYLYRRLMPPWIINFPTKDHWRSQSRLRDIEHGLLFLEQHIGDWGVESLAVPPLGCGEGGLEWRVVGPTLYEHLSRLPIPVVLYAPFDTPHDELQIQYLEEQLAEVGHADGPADRAPESKVPPAGVALVEVLRRLTSNPYHPPVGRILFQKLAYFATESGLPTGLQFVRGSFGPYAADLKKLTSRLINNSLVDERPVDRRIAVEVGPSFEKARRAYTEELEAWEPVIEGLVNLFSRMTSRQAEIAATVHFAARRLWEANDKMPVLETDVLDAVKDWKARREPPFADEDVALAIRNLGLRGWLDLTPSPELPVPEEALFA